VTQQLKVLRATLCFFPSSDDLSNSVASSRCDAFVEKGMGWPVLLAVLQKLLEQAVRLRLMKVQFTIFAEAKDHV
jgi:hypothetical protein